MLRRRILPALCSTRGMGDWLLQGQLGMGSCIVLEGTCSRTCHPCFRGMSCHILKGACSSRGTVARSYSEGCMSSCKESISAKRGHIFSFYYLFFFLLERADGFHGVSICPDIFQHCGNVCYSQDGLTQPFDRYKPRASQFVIQPFSHETSRCLTKTVSVCSVQSLRTPLCIPAGSLAAFLFCDPLCCVACLLALQT